MRALVCLPVRYIAGQMMLVRGLVLGLAMTLVEPASDPLASLPDRAPVRFHRPGAVATADAAGRPAGLPGSRSTQMHAILVGGAPVSAALEERIQTLTAPVYHTYGMTETATHVALRRLNGPAASPDFHPLPGVEIDIDDARLPAHQRPHDPRPMDPNQRPRRTLPLPTLPAPLPSSPPSAGWAAGTTSSIRAASRCRWKRSRRRSSRSGCALGLAERRFFVAGLPDERLGQVVTLVIEGAPLDDADRNRATRCARIEPRPVRDAETSDLRPHLHDDRHGQDRSAKQPGQRLICLGGCLRSFTRKEINYASQAFCCHVPHAGAVGSGITCTRAGRHRMRRSASADCTGGRRQRDVRLQRYNHAGSKNCIAANTTIDGSGRNVTLSGNLQSRCCL